jgi:hypothetical protein
MFEFGKKKPEVFDDLTKVRDLLKILVGEATQFFTGTVVYYLTNRGKTIEDVEKAKEKMLEALQRYVKSEIILDKQNHRHAPDLAELAGLR